MTRYLVHPRDLIFVKAYGFFFFAGNMGKNISKSLTHKYSQKPLDHAKQSATVAFKTATKRVILKTADDVIGSKITDKVTKVPKKIIQEHLQMKIIKKYLKKDVYLQKKNRNY